MSNGLLKALSKALKGVVKRLCVESFPDKRNSITSLSLKSPVSHESLNELILLFNLDHGGDLLDFIPGTLR